MNCLRCGTPIRMSGGCEVCYPETFRTDVTENERLQQEIVRLRIGVEKEAHASKVLRREVDRLREEVERLENIAMEAGEQS